MENIKRTNIYTIGYILFFMFLSMMCAQHTSFQQTIPTFEKKITLEEMKTPEDISIIPFFYQGSSKLYANRKKEVAEEEENIVLDEDSKMWLAKTTYAEGGLCDLDEQIAVAQAILNRKQEFNLTIYEVITQVVNGKRQFSCVIDGQVYLITRKGNVLVTEDMIPEKTWQAVEIALSGEKSKVELMLEEEAEKLGLDFEKYAANGPLYFCNVDAIPLEARSYYENLPCKVKLGYHTFYKEPVY